MKSLYGSTITVTCTTNQAGSWSALHCLKPLFGQKIQHYMCSVWTSNLNNDIRTRHCTDQSRRSILQIPKRTLTWLIVGSWTCPAAVHAGLRMQMSLPEVVISFWILVIPNIAWTSYNVAPSLHWNVACTRFEQTPRLNKHWFTLMPSCYFILIILNTMASCGCCCWGALLVEIRCSCPSHVCLQMKTKRWARGL